MYCLMKEANMNVYALLVLLTIARIRRNPVPTGMNLL